MSDMPEPWEIYTIPPEQKTFIKNYISKMIGQREAQYAEQLGEAERQRDAAANRILELSEEAASMEARIIEHERARAVLSAEVARLEEAETGERAAKRAALAELDRLDKWLRDHFPKQPRDRVNTVDAALQLLTLVHTYVPTLMRVVWVQLIKPAATFLERYGIQIDEAVVKDLEDVKD